MKKKVDKLFGESKIAVTFRIDDILYNMLKEYAIENRASMQEIIVDNAMSNINEDIKYLRINASLYKHQISIRIDEELHYKLKLRAYRRKTSMQNIIYTHVVKYLGDMVGIDMLEGKC